MDTLSGEVAVVTGGGRGIGRAIAMALAEAGAAVAVVARSREQIEETSELISSRGGTARALVADVTDDQAVAFVMREVHQTLGEIDLLVNNAGGCSSVGPVSEAEPERWWHDVETNLKSAFLCTRAVLPRMIERGTGRIVNVASYAVIRPDPYTSGYSAAKAGLVHLTGSLAAETAPDGIGVFAIAPGTVRTALTEGMRDSSGGQRWLHRLQAMRDDDWLKPELAGELVCTLATGVADRLSGRFIHVLDDLDALIEREPEIVQDDLYVLRLRR